MSLLFLCSFLNLSLCSLMVEYLLCLFLLVQHLFELFFFNLSLFLLFFFPCILISFFFGALFFLVKNPPYQIKLSGYNHEKKYFVNKKDLLNIFWLFNVYGDLILHFSSFCHSKFNRNKCIRATFLRNEKISVYSSSIFMLLISTIFLHFEVSFLGSLRYEKKSHHLKHSDSIQERDTRLINNSAYMGVQLGYFHP